MIFNFKRLVAIILTIMMVIGVMPMSVFATEGTTAGSNIEIINEGGEPAAESQSEDSESPIVITYNGEPGLMFKAPEGRTLSETLSWFYEQMVPLIELNGGVQSLEIKINGDITDTAVAELKYNTTISGTGKLTNVQLNAVEGCDSLTVSGLTFEGNSWINSGSAETLVVSDVTANVTPVNGNGTANNMTNSRSAFISLGSNEAQKLDLTVENCDISVKSNGANSILGWAAITKATITENTIDSQSGYTAYSDSIKFMSIANGASLNFVGNTIYSDYNGVALGQNTTRGNSYTANFDGNTFIGGADHVWIEVSGSNTCNGNVNVTSSNTVNGNAFTKNDIKVHPNLNTYTGYMGVDVELDNGKVIGGTLAYYSEDVIADGYKLDENGNVVADAPAGLTGSGTETDPYKIGTAEEMFLFAEKVNDGTYKNVYAVLTADIDLEQEDWTSIGTSANPFIGTFDGAGYTISNIWSYDRGLFGYTSTGNYVDSGTNGRATIKDLTLNGVEVYNQSTSAVGGLVGQAGQNTEISGVTITGYISIYGYGYVGGVVGQGYVHIDDCHVIGVNDEDDDKSTIDASYWAVAGIVGHAGSEGGASITNCSVKNVVIHSAIYGAGSIAGVGTKGPIENVSAENVNIVAESSPDANGVLVGCNYNEITGNCTVKDVVLEVAGATVTAPQDVSAAIGGTYYVTLQAAIDAVKNGETITLTADCDEVVAIDKNNVAFTIDGKDVTYTGNITIDIGQNVTIKNIKFVHTDDSACDFIANVGSPTGKNYNTTMTVEGCTFTGNGKDNVVAIRTIHPTAITVDSCEGTGLHSFMQNTGGQKIEVNKVKLTESKGGIALGTVITANVSNSNLTTRTYGIRLDAGNTSVANLDSNTVKAYIPVSVRKVSDSASYGSVTFGGSNSSYTETNTDGIWCAICKTEYESGVELNEPGSDVNVTLNDTGLNKSGVYGAYEEPGLSGSGTAEDPYLINNVDDFIFFAKETQNGNSYSGKVIKLTSDIDFEGANFLEIAEDGTVVTDYRLSNFSGTFDGGNYTIKNFNFVVKSAFNGYIMMFSSNGGYEVIRNLKIENVTVNVADITGETRITALANRLNVGGKTGAAVENVHIKNYTVNCTNTTSSDLRIGGLAYFAQDSQLVAEDCSIENFTVNANSAIILGGAVSIVKSKCDFINVDVINATFNIDNMTNVAGGFTGQTQDNGTGTTFTDCDVDIHMNFGTIATDIGGFVASIGAASQFYNCTTSGTISVTGEANGKSVGGFVGDLGWNGMGAPNTQHEFNDCAADVDITVANANVGGFIGDSTITGYPDRFIPTYFNNCEAKGDVKTESGVAGGFVGRGDRGIFNDCSASGDVEGRIAGGFWGELYPKATAESKGGWSYDKKEVTHTDANAKSVVLEGLTVSGEVSGTEYEAGLVGFLKDIHVNDDDTLGYATPVVMTNNSTSEVNRFAYDEIGAESGTWGGIDWVLTTDGTLKITPSKGTPELNPNINDGTTRYEVGAWRDAVIYKNGEASAIGGWPYDRTKVKKLVIAEGVTSIGSFTAQSYTNLTGEVVIPSTVTYIGQEAFQKSTMTKLTFAAGGTEELCIAQGAFKNLIIEEVALPEDRPVHLHAWVFNNCHELKTAYIPSTLVSAHGTNHIDYFNNFNEHSNPTWHYSSEIFAYNENMESITFGSQEAMDQFYKYNNGTSKDYTVANVGLTTYCDFADAFAAAKDGETVKLIKNCTLNEAIVNSKKITLDLGGKTITYNSTTMGEAMITNKGELTINDSVGTGVINYNYTGAADSSYGKGNYTICNAGTLTVNGGKITIAKLSGHAKYPIDNNSTTGDAILVINGGHLYNYNTSAIRMFCNSTTYKNSVTINGGLVEGYGAIWMQNPGSKTVNGSLSITGGEIRTTAKAYVEGTAELKDVNSMMYTSSQGGAWSEDSAISITGGTFNENVNLYYDAPANVTVDVENATFNGNLWLPYVFDGVNIYSLEDLKAFRDAVNAGDNYSGKTVTLHVDIDLASEEWTPIGTSAKPFNGIFDGQNHKISNLVINGGSTSDQGFFGRTNNGEIKNLTFENAKVSGRLSVGVVAGTPYTSKYTNIKVTGHVEVNGMAYVGGVGGRNAYADWTNITVDVDETSYVKADSVENNNAYRTYVGGVIGFNGEGGHKFTNITSNINVIGTVIDVGGIFGIAHYSNVIENVTCTANVTNTGDEEGPETGGIAGVWHNEKGYTVTMNNVKFTGKVTINNVDVTNECSIVGGAYNPDNNTAENSGSLKIDGNEAWLKVPVAEVNGVKYVDIAEALAAVKANDEIKLLADIDADITVPADVIFNGNGKEITGKLYLLGDVTFKGYVKANGFDFENVGTVINIPVGATFELVGGRMIVGHGCTFNIEGDIVDAKTTDKATLTPSLIMPGASFTGNGVTFNVKNAYIKVPSSYCSTSKTASGTFDFNIENSIWESAGKLAFEEQSVNATVNFELKNSVLTTSSHLVFGVSKGEIVIDNSNVNVGTSRQIENQSTMTIKNGSVVNGAVATSSNAKNPGTIIVENATYAVTGEFSGSDLGTGTIIVNKGATFSAGSITKANITIDATGMTEGEVKMITANLSKFAGTLNVINNNGLKAEIVDGKLMLVKAPAAKIGETKYETLEAALAAAQDGDTVVLLNDIELTETAKVEKAITIDGNGKKITGSDALIQIYADLTLNNVVMESGKNYYVLSIKANDCEVVLNDCTVTGPIEGYGTSNYIINSGTYKKGDSVYSQMLNGALVYGGIFHYEILTQYVAPGYTTVDNGDGTWTVKYAPVGFIDANNNGALDDGEKLFANLDQVFTNYKSGNVYVVLTADAVANNTVDTKAAAHYYINTNVAEGVKVDFLFADNWNYVQNMTIGENVTINVKYLLAWTELNIYGTVNTDYLYITGGNVTVNEGAAVNAKTGEATVQVKNGATLTVKGTVDTAILNVWSNDAKLIVNGTNAKVNASWIDIWDGTPSVTVENGATLDVDAIKASRGGSITVNDATLDSESIELGHNGESAGTLTVTGNSTVSEIKLTVVGSTVEGPEGLNVTSSVDGYEVKYADGKYTLSEVEELFKFYGSSVTMGNELNLNFFFSKDYIDNTGYAQIVRTYGDGKENETTTVSLASVKLDGSGKYYQIVYEGIAAKEMCDVLTVTIFDKDGKQISEAKVDSVRSYALRVINHPTQPAEAKTMMVDMLNYGAAAQSFKEYNTSDLANSTLTDAQKALGTQEMKACSNNFYKSNNNYYGTSFVFGNELSLKMYVNKDAIGANGYVVVTYIDHLGEEKTATINNSTLNNNYYEFLVNEIVVADGRCLLTCKFYKADGTEVVTVNESLESYVSRGISTYSWLEQVMNFSDSAYAYLHRDNK